MKVHISLVGEQLAPVYAGILHTNPDEIFLVCSVEKTMSKAQRLQSIFPDKVVHIKPFDATDLEKIYLSLNCLSGLISPDAELSINLVGGTKHWAISFYDYFSKRENTRFLLGDQSNLIWDFSELTCDRISIPMEMQLKLQGQMPDNHRNFSEYTPEDDRVAEKAEQIWTNPKYRPAFTSLTTDVEDKKIHQGFSYEPRGTDYAVFQTPDGNKTVFNSPHAVSIVKNTGWLEYKVAKLLSQWPGAKEVWCNCVFRYDNVKKDKSGKIVKSSSDLNEVDVILYDGSKLLFVECKTAIFNSTDIDKFNSVVRNYGGLASKSVFITWYEPYAEKSKKLKLNDIPYIALSKTDTETLYKKLDELMEENNSR